MVFDRLAVSFITSSSRSPNSLACVLLSSALPRIGTSLTVDGDAEGLAGGDDRPDDPGELVGQRYGHDLGRFARSERGQPVVQRALALWRSPARPRWRPTS
jgi:hypothetical protein